MMYYFLINYCYLFQAEESLPSFKDAFDIVLVDDQTMNVALDILSLIL